MTRPLQPFERTELRGWKDQEPFLFERYREERARMLATGSTRPEAEAQAYSLIVAAYRLDDEGGGVGRIERAIPSLRNFRTLCPGCGAYAHDGVCAPRSAQAFLEDLQPPQGPAWFLDDEPAAGGRAA